MPQLTERDKKEMAERKARRAKKEKRRMGKQGAKNLAKTRKQSSTYEEEERQQRRVEHGRKKIEMEAADSPAMQELASRELAKRHLLPYVQMFNPDYLAGWVHKDISNRLERFYSLVKKQKSPRIILMVPPRHGKSTLSSKEFPSWVFGNDPNVEIILASYALPLASGFSREVRDRIQYEPQYHTLFPNTKIASDSRGVEEWRLQRPNKGRFQAAGVGGPITGKGADIFIIDDPVKNREEADSLLVQQSTWNWYTSTAYTRLSPGGGMLIILTRWHEQDLGGKAIDNARKTGEEWDIIRYSALAEDVEYYDTRKRIIHVGPIDEYPKKRREEFKKLRDEGDPLHPARYDTKALLRIKETAGPRDWSALYQQRPVAEEGDYIKKKWLNFSTPIAYDGMKHIQAWDLAIGQKEHNNYSVGITGAIDWDGRIHIRDVIRGRWSTSEIAERVLRKHVEYDSVLVGIEHGHIFLAVEEDLKKLEAQYRIRPTYDDTLKPIHDKAVRARPMQGMIQRGDMVFPEDAMARWPWLFEELFKFPALGRDDGFDTLAWLARMYSNVSLPKRGPHIKKEKSWKSNLRQYREGAGAGHHLLA